MNEKTSSQKSAEEFYEKLAIVRVLRVVLKGAQALGSWAAVPLAQRLFLTPLPRGKARPASFWGQAWTCEAWPMLGGVCRTFRRNATNETAETVVLVHGWAGNGAQMRRIGDAIAESGRNAVIVELCGHAGNKGATCSLPQFVNAIESTISRLRASGLRVSSIVAHSMGSNASADAATRDDGIKKLALIALPAAPAQFTHGFARMFGINEKTRTAMQARIEATFHIRMAQFNADEFAPILNTATLVMHDEDDAVNAISQSRAWFSSLKNGQWHSTQNLGHNGILKSEAVAQRVVQFLNET